MLVDAASMQCLRLPDVVDERLWRREDRSLSLALGLLVVGEAVAASALMAEISSHPPPPICRQAVRIRSLLHVDAHLLGCAVGLDGPLHVVVVVVWWKETAKSTARMFCQALQQGSRYFIQKLGRSAAVQQS